MPPSAGRLVPAGDATALARAVAELLPAETSTQLQTGPAVLRAGTPPPYPAIFAAVASRRRR